MTASAAPQPLTTDRTPSVLAVEEDSPAQQAGLREGDVIVSLDGNPVAGVHDLHRLLAVARVDANIAVTVLRYTEKLELRVAPQEGQTSSGGQD